MAGSRSRWWWLLGAELAVWAGSWRIMHLEVHRWHHLGPTLRFTPPPVPPGTPQPRPGLPVRGMRAVAVAAPALAAATAVRLWRRTD
ncbi:hypothetical protein [Amycolatopsis benzoatilytica]|uniref:hypothetical protein n=1 Tax=Amycolatopsis benzoatilytica TaxID=346045 RepID=UPI0003694104|nr:hypothetical protein [Amycolatopsis benzoatilytica]